MKEAINNFLQKVIEDKAFAEKVFSQTEKEKIIEVAKSENIELVLEDIDEVNEMIKNLIAEEGEGELSEDDLEKVAGGARFELTVVRPGGPLIGHPGPNNPGGIDHYKEMIARLRKQRNNRSW